MDGMENGFMEPKYLSFGFGDEKYPNRSSSDGQGEPGSLGIGIWFPLVSQLSTLLGWGG